MNQPATILNRSTLRVLNLSAIRVGERQRKSMSPTKLQELEHSIAHTGLINPPVVYLLREPDGTFTHELIAGERRLTCLRKLHEAEQPIVFAGNVLAKDEIPVIDIGVAVPDLHRMKVELAENVFRDDLQWQDRDKALYIIHQLEKEANPQATLKSTAEMILAQGHEAAAGLNTVNSVIHRVQRANVVAQHLDDPAIAAARSSDEAFALILQRDDAALKAEIIRRQQARVAAKPEEQRIRIIHGDAHVELSKLPDANFDLILSDPPYGISAGAKGFRDRTVHHHNYSDTPEEALKALKLLLVDGWRLTKPIANLFIFGAEDNFPYFKQQAAAMGWKPWPDPIIWRKSLSEGLAPWGRSGFRRTYEMIFFATKGTRGLYSSPTDVLEVKRVHRSERIYGAQKPLDLLTQLIECSTMAGMNVLDPFMGSGSTLAAAKKLDRFAVGIERDKAVVDIATKFIFEADLNALEGEADNA